MADPTSILAAISTIKNAIDIAKALRSVDASLETAELKLTIAELYEVLSDAKIQMIEIQETLAEKDKQIAQLSNSMDLRSRTKRIGDAYFELDENDKPFGDPLCPVCLELGRPPIHLNADFDHFVCGACGSIFQEKRVRVSEHMRFRN